MRYIKINMKKKFMLSLLKFQKPNKFEKFITNLYLSIKKENILYIQIYLFYIKLKVNNLNIFIWIIFDKKLRINFTINK